MDKPTSYNKTVEVYVESAVLRGTIVTRHARLSDFLARPDEIFFLEDTSFEQPQEKASLPTSARVIIYKKHVIFIAELSSGETEETADAGLLRTDREPLRVLIGAGSFWLQGDLHFMPGVTLESFAEAKGHFITATNATLLGRTEAQPRTFIINREKVHSLIG
ncbi:MAG: hypothetical protein ACREQA_18070 [Candidatus Binatia bacterium]